MSEDQQAVFQSLLELHRTLDEEAERAAPHIQSITQSGVTHPDPETRHMLQREVNATIQGALVVYFFAIWESGCSREVENRWLKEHEIVELRAYRHVRNSAAHLTKGRRADRYRTEFEAIVTASDAMRGVEWDENTIDLSNSAVWLDCRRMMKALAHELVVRVSSNGKTE